MTALPHVILTISSKLVLFGMVGLLAQLIDGALAVLLVLAAVRLVRRRIA
jgi:putative flippase GtrA